MPPIPLTSRYRPDIDGLRALAVAAVIGFHAVPRLAPAGFVGVDIFFVISGFLITGLIDGELEAGRFRLRAFYERRVRRIFPALVAVLAIVTLVAWVCLLPDEWREFGTQLFGGAAFAANLFLSRQGGYFESAAHSRPLLHLWSLGVEEQFYFVWPLFVALLWKVSRPTRIAILGIVVAGSFVLNVLTIHRYPAHTFYLPVTRLWELGLGSLLALWRPARPLSRRASETCSAIGVVLLVASIALIPEASFPGAWALLPTLGTVLVIGAGAGASLNRLVLATRPFLFVGWISYPLYLWHWPLLSFLRIGRGDAPSPAVMAAAVTASVALAWATYRWVETPIRSNRRAAGPLYAVCALLVALAGVGVAAGTQRLAPRLSGPAIARQLEAAHDWEYPFGENFGRTDGFVVSAVEGKEPRAVLFIGDSNLEQYWPRIQFARAHRPSPELRFVTYGGCPPLPGIDVPHGEACNKCLAVALAAARDPVVKTVVFGAYWKGYGVTDPSAARSLATFGNEIRQLVDAKKRVYVILSSPAGRALDPRAMISRRDGSVEHQPLPLRDFLATAGAADDAVRRVALAAGAELIDPLPELCPAGICPSVTGDGRPLYRDDSHMRPFYVRERARFIDRVLD